MIEPLPAIVALVTLSGSARTMFEFTAHVPLCTNIVSVEASDALIVVVPPASKVPSPVIAPLKVLVASVCSVAPDAISVVLSVTVLLKFTTPACTWTRLDGELVMVNTGPQKIANLFKPAPAKTIVPSLMIAAEVLAQGGRSVHVCPLAALIVHTPRLVIKQPERSSLSLFPGIVSAPSLTSGRAIAQLVIESAAAAPIVTAPSPLSVALENELPTEVSVIEPLPAIVALVTVSLPLIVPDFSTDNCPPLIVSTVAAQLSVATPFVPVECTTDGNAAPMSTSSVATGTPSGLQFAAVFQSVLPPPPSHVFCSANACAPGRSAHRQNDSQAIRVELNMISLLGKRCCHSD